MKGPQTMTGKQELTKSERCVLEAAEVGALADLRPGGGPESPAKGANWSARRTVRADLLVELLTGILKPNSGSVRSVKVCGARIAGTLDLEDAVLMCPLVLVDCFFENRINLVRAEASVVRLVGCHTSGLDAGGLRTSGDLEIGHGFTTKKVQLLAARVGGQLCLNGARLNNPDGVALDAAELSVDQSMFCSDGFAAVGRVDLNGARIGGQLRLSGATLANPGGLALTADQLTVERSMHCNDGFSATGTVWLAGAHIGKRLDFSGAVLKNPAGDALIADQVSVGHSLICRNGFSSVGELRLNGAHIGGDLDFNQAGLRNPGGRALSATGLAVIGVAFFCGSSVTGQLCLAGARVEELDLTNARLTNENRAAFSADGLTVEGAMFCRLGSVVTGEFRLLGAHIGGNLEFTEAIMNNPGGVALNADGITVNRTLLGKRLTTQGAVRLPGAHIGGTVDFTGAHLTNSGGWALAADQMTVALSMDCTNGFSAVGEVRLHGARIGGQLGFVGASLHNPGGFALSADRLTVEMDILCREGFSATGQVRLGGARIEGHLDFRRAKLVGSDGCALMLAGTEAGSLFLRTEGRPDGVVVLSSARVRDLHDDPTTWPAVLDLDGFSYDTLGDDPANVRDRLSWLARQDGGYRPALYDQLAAVYRRAGREEDARRVAITKQWRRRHALDPLGKAWNWLLYLTVGYGYRTWLAGVWLAVLAAMGSLVFDHAYGDHQFQAATPAPAFHPVIYSLDVLLPIVDFGQQRAWSPQGPALYLSWVLISGGWILTTAVVAGLTKMLKRE